MEQRGVKEMKIINHTAAKVSILIGPLQKLVKSRL
jgi:hypothetical protein